MNSDTPRTDALYKNLYQPGIPDDLIESASGIERDFMRQLERENRELAAALQKALRYIEVDTAYKGAMTADQVEAAIRGEHFPSVISIGANSCNTLAEFSFTAARAALAKVQP